MIGRRISVIASMKHGASGWLLRWSEDTAHLSYWFAGKSDAESVRDALRRGASLADAIDAAIERTTA